MDVINALGRRKKAIARIYLKEGKGDIIINKRDYKQFFPAGTLHYVVEQPLQLTESLGKYDIKVNLNGGGIMVERKKPGQPKARKKFQFSKR